MRMMPTFAALAGVAVAAVAAEAAPSSAFKVSVVTIMTAGGPHRIKVEVASDAQQRAVGLTFRPRLAKDSGMLSLYPAPQPVAMVMKNKLISLDVLFIAADGTISLIRERAAPNTPDAIPSQGMVKAVLELGGGTVARLGIKPGDQVVGEGLGQ